MFRFAVRCTVSAFPITRPVSRDVVLTSIYAFAFEAYISNYVVELEYIHTCCDVHVYISLPK